MKTIFRILSGIGKVTLTQADFQIDPLLVALFIKLIYSIPLDNNWKIISVRNITSPARNNLNFSQIVVTFEMQRNHPFHTMTLILPILVLTILAPVGLILPGIFFQHLYACVVFEPKIGKPSSSLFKAKCNEFLINHMIFKLWRYFSKFWRKNVISSHNTSRRNRLHGHASLYSSSFRKFGFRWNSTIAGVFRYFDHLAMFLFAFHNRHAIFVSLSEYTKHETSQKQRSESVAV